MGKLVTLAKFFLDEFFQTQELVNNIFLKTEREYGMLSHYLVKSFNRKHFITQNIYNQNLDHPVLLKGGVTIFFHPL